jgi:hypothetical protein
MRTPNGLRAPPKIDPTALRAIPVNSSGSHDPEDYVRANAHSRCALVGRPSRRQKKARLNCIHHLLTLVPFHEVERERIILPERIYNEDYYRQPVASGMFVPAVY